MHLLRLLEGELVAQPHDHYSNNVTGSLNVLEAMKRHACRS